MDRDSGGMTRALAREHARDFDVIMAKAGTYSAYVSAMHAENSELVLLAYMNAVAVQPGEGDSYPSSWYLYDADGNKVTTRQWGNYLMNPASRGWVDDRIALCRRLLDNSGYDGCVLDVLGPAPVTAGFTSGQPINPATGRPWSAKDWMTATGRLAGKVGSAVAPHVVWGNGLGDGPRYFQPDSPTSMLLEHLDGGMAEGFLRSGRARLLPYPSPEDWKASVDMLVDAERRGKRIVVSTKVWNTGTKVEKDAWHKFALASFLMGAQGGSRFVFLYDESLDPMTQHAWWDAGLGAPSGAYYRRSTGVYQRDFADGLVLVNPTGDSKRVRLNAVHVTIDGRSVTEIRLAPTSAEIALKAGN